VRAARGAGDELMLGRALNLLGVVCKDLGHFRRSESCYRRALPIFERAFGEEHPSLATLYHNLGGVLYAQGRWPSAEYLTRRAVALRRAALGGEHRDVIADQACLAAILAARGKHAEAETLYRRAIRFFATRCRVGYEVAINSSNLAVLLASMGRHRAAESNYQRAIRLYRAMPSAPPHDLALALYNLGALRAAVGRPSAARLLKEAYGLFLGALGPRHPLTRESRRRLAAVRPSSAKRSTHGCSA